MLQWSKYIETRLTRFVILYAMQYLYPILLGGIGSFFLYKGATLFLDHSSALARYWRVPLIIIGLTIVAIGTSLPELIVGILAGIEGQNDLVLGNVLGSNMANIGIVLGISALIYPIHLDEVKRSRLELYSLIFSVALLYLMVLDSSLSRLDGSVLIVCGLVFLGLAIRYHRHEHVDSEEVNTTIHLTRRKDLIISVMAVGAGLILLLVGARMIVTNAVTVARLFHLSELFIGITLVAIGTSLPEIITSIVGSVRKSNDLVLGNVIGSNIINVLLVLGITVCITPISVATNFWKLDLPLLLVATVILTHFMYTGKKLGRAYGIMLISMYALYILIASLVERF